MSYQAGDTYPATVTIKDEDGAPTDPFTLTLKVRDGAGTVTTYEYGVGSTIVRDSVGLYHADMLLDAEGMWVIEWSIEDEEQVEGVQIWVSGAPTVRITFCSVTDIATRLGRELTTEEQATVQLLCELVTGEIAAAVGEDADWPSSLESIPGPLRRIAIDVVTRVMVNPGGFSSTSETLGAYSYTQRYGSDEGGSAVTGVALTAHEARRVRRAVFGAGVSTVEIASIFDSELPLP